MGFGAYDEDDQEQFDTKVSDEDEENAEINQDREEHDMTFDFGGKDTSELLDELKED